VAELGAKTIAEHNLTLARRFAAALDLPEPTSPIVRVEVEKADEAVERLRSAGVACSSRSGSIRFAFHLYNDDEDIDLALEALQPSSVFDAEA
jgi:selenocysteine lyase/cysteine desulfurase